jgi:hypothetical protein
LEAQRAKIAETMYKCHRVALDGLAMYDLFKNPDKVFDLSVCALDSILNAPGGLDTFTELFLPIISMVNQQTAQSAPQQPQPQFAAPQIVQSGQQPQFNFNYPDPQQQARANFPAMPSPAGQSGQSATQLDQIPPHERWKAIDQGLI